MTQKFIPDAIKSIASNLSLGQFKRKCPECQDTRSKHKHDRPLSLLIDPDGVRYHCHHCDMNGGWMYEQDLFKDYDYPAPKPIKISDGSNEIATAYLKGRNLTDDVINEHTVRGTYRFNGKVSPAIGFPYRDGSSVVAIKWRSADDKKLYSQENICRDFFNLESYVKGNDILLVEGEIDALSWMSCDLPENLTVMSIPNGAPSKVRDGKVDPSEDRKFQYVWRAKKELDSAEKIILCFDNDEPGVALRDEILRRIGTSKVNLVDLEDYKDASQALASEGEGYLLEQLEDCSPVPTVGLYGAEVFTNDFVRLYEEGQMRGAKTGIPSLDKLIQIVPGHLTVVTGFPSSGNSDLVDQICLNLARSNGWKTCYCSFEKPPALHMAQLSQKLMNMPFFDGVSTRMSREERDYSHDWIKDNFLFMDHTVDSPCDIDGILDVASKAVMRMGCRVLVIDPYNFIELPSSDRETDAINKMLTKVQKWIKTHDAHCFFVSHPTKLSPDRRSARKVIVTGHDIAGSAAWFSKADLGITAWRHPTDEAPPECHVWKVRWSWVGTHGSTRLRFDRVTSRWSDYVHEIEDESYWDL